VADATWTEAEVVALIAAGCYASPPTEEQMRDGALRAETWLATHDEAVRAEEREKCAQIAEEAEDLRAAYLDFWGAHSSNDIQRVGREPRLVATPMLDRIREPGKEQGND